MPRQHLKVRPDGRCRCKYNGLYFYGKTETEAYAKRDAYKRELEKGLKAEAAGVTVSAYAEKWLKTYKSNVSKKTRDMYERHLILLCTECGDKKIQDVTPSDIQRAYNAKAGKSKSDINKCKLALNGLFEAAVADGLAMRNPCKKAIPPAGKSGSHRAIEQWERDIVDTMSETDHRFAAAAMVMLYAGLRRGEMLALNIDRDVNFERRTITVREAVRFDGNRPEIVDPKTEAGKREIPLLAQLEGVLKGRHGLVVAMPNGTPLSQIAFKRAWDSYLYSASTMLNNGRRKRWLGKTKEDKAALERDEKLPEWKDFNIRTHDLRHSYCTMLYEAGIDLKTAQKWLGHADQAMTMKIYTHLTEKQETAAAEKLHKFTSRGQIGGQDKPIDP